MDHTSATLILIASLVLSPYAAHAASGCPGPAAEPGSAVRGPVLMIPQGSVICVALAAPPATWVLVRLPPQGVTREVAMAALFARTATCRIGADGTGDCHIEGLPLAEALRRANNDPRLADWRASDKASPADRDTGAGFLAEAAPPRQSPPSLP